VRARLAVAVVVASGVLVAPASGSSAAARWFVTPGNQVSCELGLGRPHMHPGTYVWCLAYRGGRPYKTARAVRMNSSAKLSVCRGLRCIGNSPVGTPVLKVGRSIDFGPFRCTSLRQGVRCIVAKSGHGFRLTLRDLTRI
jgi:hypothetical protein